MSGFLDYLGITSADPDDVARPGIDAGVRIVTTAQHANINDTVHAVSSRLSWTRSWARPSARDSRRASAPRRCP